MQPGTKISHLLISGRETQGETEVKTEGEREREREGEFVFPLLVSPGCCYHDNGPNPGAERLRFSSYSRFSLALPSPLWSVCL